MNDWIDVKDRLPADGDEVIAFNGNNVGALTYFKRENLWCDYHSYYWPKVIYWMPLPPLPKE